MISSPMGHPFLVEQMNLQKYPEDETCHSRSDRMRSMVWVIQRMVSS